MFRIVVTFILVCGIFCQDAKPQRTLDNDLDFLEKFQVEVLHRDTIYNLYAKEGEELLVHYHGMTPDGKVMKIFIHRSLIHPFKEDNPSRFTWDLEQ